MLVVLSWMGYPKNLAPPPFLFICFRYPPPGLRNLRNFTNRGGLLQSISPMVKGCRLKLHPLANSEVLQLISSMARLTFTSVIARRDAGAGGGLQNSPVSGL